MPTLHQPLNGGGSLDLSAVAQHYVVTSDGTYDIGDATNAIRVVYTDAVTAPGGVLTCTISPVTGADHAVFVLAGANVAAVTRANGIVVSSGYYIGWASTGDATGTFDTGFSRLAAGVVGIRDNADAFCTIGKSDQQQTAAADTDGIDTYYTAETGGAHTSNDPDGGSHVFVPGAAGSGGSGVAGAVTVQQPGGTPGTDDADHYHDGDDYYINPNSGYVAINPVDTDGGLKVIGSGSENIVIGTNISTERIKMQVNLGVSVVSSYYYGWGSTTSSLTTIDTRLVRADAGVVAVNGASGGGTLEFPVIADVPSAQTDSAGLGAEDVSASGELIGYDEAGNETQLTPHAVDGPAWLYDETPGIEEVHRTINRFADRVDFINITRQAKLAGMLDAEKALLTAQERTSVHREDLAAYNARSGRNKTKLDWDTVQNQKQARYDAERQAESDSRDQWDTERQAELDAHGDWQTVKLPAAIQRQETWDAEKQADVDKWNEWNQLDRDGQVLIPEPAVRSDSTRPKLPKEPSVRPMEGRPAVRPTADIRKPKPPQLQQRTP